MKRLMCRRPPCGFSLSHAGRWGVVLGGVVLLILLLGLIRSAPAATADASGRLEGGVHLVKPHPTPTPTSAPCLTPTPRPTTPASPTPTALPPTATPRMAPTATGASTQTPDATTASSANAGGAGSTGDSWLTTLWWGLGAAGLAVLGLGAFLWVVARRIGPRP
jgi:hypothetical protein